MLTPPDLEHQLAELPLVLLIAQKELKVLGFPAGLTLHYGFLREAVPNMFLFVCLYRVVVHVNDLSIRFLMSIFYEQVLFIYVDVWFRSYENQHFFSPLMWTSIQDGHQTSPVSQEFTWAT